MTLNFLQCKSLSIFFHQNSANQIFGIVREFYVFGPSVIHVIYVFVQLLQTFSVDAKRRRSSQQVEYCYAECPNIGLK